MRILFTSHPMSGHYHPLQPVASAALAVGHEVAFATGTNCEQSIQRSGFGYFPAGVNPEDPAVAEVLAQGADLNGLEQMLFALTQLFTGVLADRMAPDLERILKEYRPDVVVSEVTEFVGPMLAEKLGLPAVSLQFGVVHPREALLPILGPRIERLRTLLGLDPAQLTASLDRALVLVFATPSYQLPGVPLGDNTFLFRPRVFDRSGDEQLPAWFDTLSERPIVYGTLGTVPTFNERPGALRTVIDALADCDVHGIVTTGRNQDPAGFGALPSNVRVERYIPQSLLLDRCNAVVGHGGYGTTMGALCFGVPLVITPFGADQPIHAMRCAELGLAEAVMPENFSREALAAALQRVLGNPSYAERARAFRREIEAMPPMEEAIAKLEAFAR
jgi:UDP:flavonoid glycosyltransferase YjiC (YdhE family)